MDLQDRVCVPCTQFAPSSFTRKNMAHHSTPKFIECIDNEEIVNLNAVLVKCTCGDDPRMSTLGCFGSDALLPELVDVTAYWPMPETRRGKSPKNPKNPSHTEINLG